MEMRFWSRPTARLLPGQVKKAVVGQFRIDEIAADKLRCVGKSGQLPRRRVRYIRLYDPKLVSHDAGNKVGYDELPLSPDQKALHSKGTLKRTVWSISRTSDLPQSVRNTEQSSTQQDLIRS